MTRAARPRLTARKQPQQARSAGMVNDILEAAVRVLMREGAARFTTVRVAAEAGVSVGSLYQYFPNKESLLFRLQADEWSDTWAMLDRLLSDRRLPPPERLRRAVLAFFRTERAEAGLRVALDDAGALLRDAPEARALAARSTARLEAFVAEALPDATPAARAFAADFVATSLGAIAEEITSQGRPAAEIDRWAMTCADLLCDHLARAARASRRPPARRARP